MLKARGSLGVLLVGLALCLCPAWTREKSARASSPLAPYPPIDSRYNAGQPNEDEKDSETLATEAKPVVPDKPPLSGALEVTLGKVSRAHSFLLPSFQFSQALDTNGFGSPTSSQRAWLSNLMGRIALQRNWSRYQLMADYVGGGFVSPAHSELNGAIHQFGLAQTIKGERWELLLADQLSALPKSFFGVAGFGGFGDSSLALGGDFVSPFPGLNPILLPNQTALTGRTGRISNTVLGQVTYDISPRSSVTVSGSYGILHAREPGFVNSNNTMIRTGYNYALTRRDSLAVIYEFGMLRFSGVNTKLNNHVVRLSYGRQITDRLALQAAAGPQLATFRNPLRGPTAQLFWSAQGSLLYRFPKTYLDVSYLGYISGGGGVLFGAETHTARMTVGRQLSKTWSGSVSLGYARYGSLRQTTVVTPSRGFDFWSGSVDLSRNLGRYTKVHFSYSLQRHGFGTPVCTAGSCGTNLVRHQIWIGFSWNFRPIGIE